MQRHEKWWITPALFSLVLLVSSPILASTIRVPGDQATIQAAVDVAVKGDIIVVADGLYSGMGNQDVDFMGKAIKIISQNGPGNCILDGGGAGRGFWFHSQEKATSIVSGLTIQNGNGGTMGGGGILCEKSSPTIMNCIIKSNDSGTKTGGGGIKTITASPKIINCFIISNTTAFDGGGIACDSGRPKIINCVIASNTAAVNGGGMALSFSKPTIVNCTITGNDAGKEGGAIQAERTVGSITNSIMWADTPDEVQFKRSTKINIAYSDVQGGFSGTNNIRSDPMFADTLLHLKPESPCVDAGTNSPPLAPSKNDLDGNPRIVGVMDMGAYEQ